MPRSFRRRFRYERRPPWQREGEARNFGNARPRGPLLPGRALNPRLQKELRRANRLLAVGEHQNAGQIFADLATRAYDHDILYPAPMLFLQAAHAYLLGENYQLSVLYARRGLELLAAQERWVPLATEGERYLDELQATQQPEAALLRTWLEGFTLPAAEPASTPDKCPYCGAAGSLEPLAAGRGRAMECRYCASIVLVAN